VNIHKTIAIRKRSRSLE